MRKWKSHTFVVRSIQFAVDGSCAEDQFVKSMHKYQEFLLHEDVELVAFWKNGKNFGKNMLVETMAVWVFTEK